MRKPMRALSIGAIVVGVCVALVATVGYVVVKFADLRVPFVSDTCRIYGNSHVVTLKPTQLTHAATIAAVGTGVGVGSQGIAVAIATALQESKLHNIAHGDLDSVGLFQQRPSQGWGTTQQLHDPNYASRKFFAALKKVPGWKNQRIGIAAQGVQHSAHPEAYEKWEEDSIALASALSGEETRAVSCRIREKNAVSGEAAVQQLRAAFTRDFASRHLLPVGNPPRSTLILESITGTRSGWQAAHWLVAKSGDFGVSRVAYDGAAWSAERGKWEADGKAAGRPLTVRVKS